MVALTVLAAALPVFQAVILKMLPFDNKSELQVVVDMPERTPMEQTQRVLMEMGSYLETVDEVANWQTYAGTASPINFNGLVRQYYLRGDPYHGDIQVNLIHEERRERQSHAIAQSIRGPLTEIGKQHGASVKIVEVPPGPPVLSPVVAPDICRCLPAMSVKDCWMPVRLATCLPLRRLNRWLMRSGLRIKVPACSASMAIMVVTF